MTTFRIVLAILAIIPVALLTDAIFLHPTNYGENSLGELAFLVFGVPILIFNLWAWGYPRIIEIYFFGKKDEGS